MGFTAGFGFRGCGLRCRRIRVLPLLFGSHTDVTAMLGNLGESVCWVPDSKGVRQGWVRPQVTEVTVWSRPQVTEVTVWSRIRGRAVTKGVRRQVSKGVRRGWVRPQVSKGVRRGWVRPQVTEVTVWSRIRGLAATNRSRIRDLQKWCSSKNVTHFARFVTCQVTV